MLRLLHLPSTFPSTGKSVPEISRIKAKAHFLSHFKNNNPNVSLSLRKHVCAASATTQDEISPEIEITTSNIHDLKNMKRVTQKNLVDAYQLFEEMLYKGQRPKTSLARTLIYIFCSRCLIRKAVGIVELMLRSDSLLDEETCTFMIKSLCKKGAHECAIQLLDEMLQRGCTVDPGVYLILIMSICGQSYRGCSWHHLEKIIQKGFVPTTGPLLPSLIDAAYLQGGAYSALYVLYQLMLRGVEPNLSCYSHILTAFKKENRANEALELFSVLSRHMKFNSITYNIVLEALGDQGRWREAEALFDSMMKRGIRPSIVTYQILISVIANNGYANDALEIAEELVRNGFKTDAWCFNPIIAQFCSERRLDMVHKCLENMERWNCPSNEGTYKAITVLCKEGMVDEAFDILQSLRQKKGAMLGFFYEHVVLPYLCRNGSSLEAFQILTKLTQVGYPPSSNTVSLFIVGLCMEGLHEEALNMFEVMDKYSIQPDVNNYNKLVIGLCKGGRIDLAIMALEKMVMKGYKLTQSTYVNVIEAIGCQGRKDIVVEVLRELYAIGQVNLENIEKICVKFCLDNVEF